MKGKSMKPEPGKKQVRIDHRTVIFVNKDIPDNVAIARYKEKREIYASAGGRAGSLKRKNDGLQFAKEDD